MQEPKKQPSRKDARGELRTRMPLEAQTVLPLGRPFERHQGFYKADPDRLYFEVQWSQLLKAERSSHAHG